MTPAAGLAKLSGLIDPSRSSPPASAPRIPLDALRLLALVTLGLSSPAAAKIAVLPFSGNRTPGLERQVSATLCPRFGCVPAAQVLTRGKVDWDKVSRAALEGVVTGRVTARVRRRQVLDLALLIGPRKAPAYHRRLSASNGALGGQALVGVRSDIGAALSRARKTAPPRPAPLASPTPPPATPTPEAPAIAPPPPGEEPVPPTEAEIAEPPTSDWPPVAYIQAGVDIAHRSLSYADLAPGVVLRNQTVPVFVAPRIRAGLFPLRRPSGWFESLGIEASYALSVGVLTHGPGGSGPSTYPTSLTDLTGALRLRLRLGSVVLAPTAGLRRFSVTVDRNQTGQSLTGLPAVAYTAVRAGLGVEVPLGQAITVFAEVAYLHLLSGGDLFASPFFPGSSGGLSLDGELGVAWQLTRPLELRFSAVGSRFALELKDLAPPRATSATDASIGGALALRYSF